MVFPDVDYVEGSWTATDHSDLAGQPSAVSGQVLSAAGMKVVKLGAVASDTYIPGMTTHPEWHGFTSCQPNNVWQYYLNYMSAYILNRNSICNIQWIRSKCGISICIHYK